METWVRLNLQLSPRTRSYEICRGGNSVERMREWWAGIFSARMIPKASSESHAVRCVYHPKARNPDWDPDTNSNPNPNPQSTVGDPPKLRVVLYTARRSSRSLILGYFQQRKHQSLSNINTSPMEGILMIGRILPIVRRGKTMKIAIMSKTLLMTQNIPFNCER